MIEQSCVLWSASDVPTRLCLQFYAMTLLMDAMTFFNNKPFFSDCQFFTLTLRSIKFDLWSSHFRLMIKRNQLKRQIKKLELTLRLPDSKKICWQTLCSFIFPKPSPENWKDKRTCSFIFPIWKDKGWKDKGPPTVIFWILKNYSVGESNRQRQF